MTDLDSGPRITIGRVFDAVQELKLEVRVLIQQNRVAEERYADHEARIRNTEKWRYTIPPTLILAGASVAIAILT